MLWRSRYWLDLRTDERGDVASWSLLLLMSASLVVVIFGVARQRLLDIVTTALSSVCGGIGC